MATAKRTHKKVDLSEFGKKKYTVGMVTKTIGEIAGNAPDTMVAIKEVKHGGAMFIVEAIQGAKNGSIFIVGANQLS